MVVKRVDHIAIVVPDIEAAITFWQDALGLEPEFTERLDAEGVIVAFLPAGDSEIELVEPIDEDGGVARYMRKRGPGIHHICLEVDDIRATLSRLKAAGVRLIDEEPRIGSGGKKIAFVHPKSTYGVLVELYETTPEEPARRLEVLDRMRRQLAIQGQVAAMGMVGFIRALRGRQHPVTPYPGDGEENGC